MGTLTFKVDGKCIAVWKEADPIPTVAKRHCVLATDIPKVKREGFVTHYCYGHCRLEYTPDK
jgi:hypothetical protein